ncbi:tetratricopeptide repeat protein [Ornithinibacillus sp. FSL M8-0202]|uniref:tetratricopeptide repeat protein n=1 Tax=Ornithinibacillus sp. FSL M8-0202 TaxID=2921616 RepID=UPI0030D19E70
MNHEDENIILFPKWGMTLKEEGFQALQEKRYHDALTKLNELLQYHIHDHEVIIGKLMCLMELGRYQEAEELCESMIENKQEEHYFHYVHIYLTILFQTNKYDVLMDLIEVELASENLPAMLREQFIELYNLSEKMESDIVEKQSTIFIEELLEAVSLSNYEKQWQTIIRLRSMEAELDNRVIQLLGQNEVHPVVKTAIFCWLQEQHVTKQVDVEKQGVKITVKPHDVPEIAIHPTFKGTLAHLHEVEQENPTLYQFLHQLLYRYCYVQYPILPPESDTELLAESLKMIGYQIMDQQGLPSMQDKGKILLYRDDILTSEQLYLSIIED